MRFYTGEVLEEHKRNVGGVLMFSRRTEPQKCHVVSQMSSAAAIVIAYLNVITASICTSRVTVTGLSRLCCRRAGLSRSLGEYGLTLLTRSTYPQLSQHKNRRKRCFRLHLIVSECETRHVAMRSSASRLRYRLPPPKSSKVALLAWWKKTPMRPPRLTYRLPTTVVVSATPISSQLT